MGEKNKVLDNKNPHKLWQTALISVTGQVGCSAVIVIGSAILLGRWLDQQLGNNNAWFTIGMLVLSVPVVLYLTIQLAIRSTNKLGANNVEEEFERHEELKSDN
ncbi:MAG TPA: hypothetical protein DCL76_01675 [Chloroflexi bacterium]|nr:hypothetical protein [Chloroflexota bacterium]